MNSPSLVLLVLRSVLTLTSNRLVLSMEDNNEHQRFRSNDNNNLLFDNRFFEKYYNKKVSSGCDFSNLYFRSTTGAPTIDNLSNCIRGSFVNLKPFRIVFDRYQSTFPNCVNYNNNRKRNEKRPVPDEEKDAIYYEKRKKNNKAAKKSRDARKLREDQLAFKVTILENENALLTNQILTLKEEVTLLRHLLMEEKKFKFDTTIYY